MENVQKPSTSIKTWAPADRPMEKLQQHGATALSTAEVIAILLRAGNRNHSAIQLAQQLLQSGHNNLNELSKCSFADLKKIKGIGLTKAASLIAAFELGRRRQADVVFQKTAIRSSADLAEFVRTQIKDYRLEVFAVVYLNRANKINYFEIVSKGGLTGTVADPRVILKKALESEATSIVLSHNHPSGNPKPSKADEDLTIKIKMAAAFMDIKVLDHIIVTEEGYFSFADEGMM
ncbi:MAG: DNA repair protein RadC [Sphingobacteriales bacterium]|jgi:DNA repair protein RadC|nr:DNA repair protein RadC [Sphingobacteriales bacterium]